MESLAAAVHATLASHPPLVEVVADRIHHGAAAEGGALPHVVFAITRNVPRQAFAATHLDAEVSLEAVARVADGAQAAVAVSDLCCVALHDAGLAIAGHTGASAACVERGQLQRDGEVYRVRSRYRVWATAT